MLKKINLRRLGLTVMASLLTLALKAQDTGGDYKRIAKERADKIVANLNIKNKSKTDGVSALIAAQYENLNLLHSQRDADIKAAANDTAKINQIKTQTDVAVKKLHATYLSGLAKQLTPTQVDDVKNGMTYNTVPLTYANYLLMLPYLTQEQQDKVKGYLTEARELAMDGSTAKEKQQWFGKYKGRIANYLSGQGYQLKKEGEDWAQRRDTASKAIPIQRTNTVMRKLKLDSTNKARNESVRNLVALHYQTVEQVTAAWTASLQKNKDTTQSKDVRDKAEHESWLAMRGNLEKKRDQFLGKLNTILTKAQVDTIKSAMTNDGLNKEYNHYLSLFPNLKSVEKQKVYNYLTEARDNAINVLTIREVKQWFAKFRGRANNYLAAQGYNLRKATEDWEKKYGKKSPY